MKYKYDDISKARPGDIVERVGDTTDYSTKGKLYIVIEQNNLLSPDYSTYIRWNDDEGNKTFSSNTLWKLIKTKPVTIDTPTDTPVICISDTRNNNHIVETVSEITKTFTDKTISVKNNKRFANYCDYLELCLDDKKIVKHTRDVQRDDILECTKSGRNTCYIPITVGNKYVVSYDVTDHSIKLNQFFIRPIEDISAIPGAMHLDTDDCEFIIINNTDSSLDISEQEIGPTEAIQDVTYQESTNAEEQIMKNDTTNIEIKVNRKDVNLEKHHAAACLVPKSEFETKSSIIARYFNHKGEHVDTRDFSGKKALNKAKNVLREPNAIGWTLVPYIIGKSSRVKITLETI